MTTVKAHTFLAEVWTKALLDAYKDNLMAKINIPPKRSKGTKLLRAAAKGASQEEIDKIDRDEETEFILGVDAGGMTTTEVYSAIKNHTVRVRKDTTPIRPFTTSYTLTGAFNPVKTKGTTKS